LVTSAPADSTARERLEAVSKTQDGFELSRIDLEQRREGDVLGATQSGSRSHLRLLRVLRDEDLIDSARHSAAELLAQDPELGRYPLLKSELVKLQADAAAEFIDKG
jgi:ATP-dependent DNA helicase RecG